ncbi:MFS transporter [Streptomyces mirabilis]|uniref:MFS transporter n=1 Tax=Streptomyces mirabilis TaxID=68239 RepID=UPI003653BDB2
MSGSQAEELGAGPALAGLPQPRLSGPARDAASRLGKYGPAFLIGHLGWAAPSAAAAALLQALAEKIDPANKIAFFGAMSTAGGVCASAAMIVTGALSDRTRSRFGRRKPWILCGAVLAACAMALIGASDSKLWIITLFAVYKMGESASVGALFALMPDRLASNQLGRASGVAGLGYLLGQSVGTFAAAAFLTMPAAGLAVLPWIFVLCAVLVVLLVPGRSSLDRPRRPVSAQELLRSLRPPSDKDFWLAFAGRFLFIFSFQMVLAYNLYLVTDYLGLTTKAAGGLMSAAILVFVAAAAVAAATTGRWSDRWVRRKPFVAGASLLVLLAVLAPAAAPETWAYLLFFLAAGVAFGTYTAVDQALMVEVLPGGSEGAKDLAFLNAANALPQILAPGAAGLLVTLLGYPGMFLCGGLAAAVGAVLILLIKRVR